MFALKRLIAPLVLMAGLYVAADGVSAAAAAEPERMPGEHPGQALRALEKASKQANSDVLIVWHDGRIVSERYGAYAPDQLYETMSATKGIVALAVGVLLQEGKLKSLDQPVAEIFPQWRQGRKAKITVRHLLTHTSGLQNESTTDVEIYPSPDFVQLALSAELKDAPGEVWAYNNKASNLIPGIVHELTGQPIDVYLKARLFDPIGLTEFHWVKDSAGNPHGMSGFQVSGRELLRIGLFVLNRGKVGDRQLIAPEFFDELAKPDFAGRMPISGHLWWRLAEATDLVIDDDLLERMRKGGAAPAFVDKLATIRGVYSDNQSVGTAHDAYVEAFRRAFGANYREELLAQVRASQVGVFPKLVLRNVIGIAARGSYGQDLIVVPEQKLVIVRLVSSAKPGFDEVRDSFQNLDTLAVRLAAAYRHTGAAAE
jgi:CubicO group peptidase (beta-lactamase class C family)